MKPKVSVIIPTYNREKFIIRAIDTVLKQTFSDFEIIVVDDGSRDNTRQLIEPLLGKIKYIYQENQGVSAARNKGIEESRGEYIAFLDSDDFWAADKLDCQVRVLDNNPNIGIVYARMPILNEKGERVGMKPSGEFRRNFEELLHGEGDLPTSTVMIRRVCFDRVGMFDRNLTIGEDTEMWLRISQFWDLFEIEGKELAFYSRHESQVTQNKINVLKGAIKTNIKILNTYAEAPQKMINERIAVNEYMVAREYYNEGHYPDALAYLCRAWKKYFFLGRLFFNADDHLIAKLWKLVKPFGFLMICSMRSLFKPHSLPG